MSILSLMFHQRATYGRKQQHFSIVYSTAHVLQTFIISNVHSAIFNAMTKQFYLKVKNIHGYKQKSSPEYLQWFRNL